MRKTAPVITTLLAALATSSAASAATIIGIGDPANDDALVGGSQITFSDVAPGSYDSFSRLGVTFSGAGSSIRVGTERAGAFNTTGAYLDNILGSTPTLSFMFEEPVTAFAFNFGASDSVWSLSAFAEGVLVDSLLIERTRSSNAGEYFGLAGEGITSAILTVDARDWVFVDNFTFTRSQAAAVPEPGSWILMLLGFGLVGAAMRARKTKEALSLSN